MDITGIDNARLQKNPVYKKQIEKSDLIMFNKTDLINDGLAVNNKIHKFQSFFPQVTIYDSFTIDLSLLEMDLTESGEKSDANRFSMFDPSLSVNNYLQINRKFDADVVFETNMLSRLFIGHPSVLRAKGYLHTEMGWKLLNYTLSDCLFETFMAVEQNEIVIIADKTEPGISEIIDSEIKKIMFWSK